MRRRHHPKRAHAVNGVSNMRTMPIRCHFCRVQRKWSLHWWYVVNRSVVWSKRVGMMYWQNTKRSVIVLPVHKSESLWRRINVSYISSNRVSTADTCCMLHVSLLSPEMASFTVFKTPGDHLCSFHNWSLFVCWRYCWVIVWILFICTNSRMDRNMYHIQIHRLEHASTTARLSWTEIGAHHPFHQQSLPVRFAVHLQGTDLCEWQDRRFSQRIPTNNAWNHTQLNTIKPRIVKRFTAVARIPPLRCNLYASRMNSCAG